MPTTTTSHVFASRLTYVLAVHCRLHHAHATALDYRCELCNELYQLLDALRASEAAPTPPPATARRH